MNSISIMQGRLSPAENGRFQFFPTDWPAEFSQAKSIGLDGICWFLDLDKPGFDPIKNVWGDPQVLSEIDKSIKILPIRGVDTGVYGFFGAGVSNTISAFKIFLPAVADRLTGGILSIPLLEKNFPKSEIEKKETAKSLRQIANLGKTLGLRFALEMEWPVEQATDFLNFLNCENIGICYDIGNATSYGFDCPSEIRRLNKKIFDVHLKDRRVDQTQSMLLGTGDADFAGCFQALKEIDYEGGLTMQAWRGDDYLKDTATQLIFVKKCLSSR